MPTLSSARQFCLRYAAYLAYQDWAMRNMDIVEIAIPSAPAWEAAGFLLVFAMWSIMMLPLVTPMVLLFVAVNRKRRERQQPFVAT